MTQSSNKTSRRFWLNVAAGIGFSLLLTLGAFLVLRATEIGLCLALAPCGVGPLLWPVVFGLSTNLHSRSRRAVFLCLMAAHYLGLSHSLWREESYEWPAYWSVLKYAFVQLLVYVAGQVVLWKRFFRAYSTVRSRAPRAGARNELAGSGSEEGREGRFS